MTFELPTARFIGASTAADAPVVIFGAGFDCTASFRPGTRFGPAAIRQVSDGIETYCPLLDADLEDRHYADLGDVALSFGAAGPQIERVQAAARALLQAGQIPFMLGGEHSLTRGPVAAALEKHPDLVLLQIDAHADLRQDYLGDRDSHACVMRRCAELGAELIQLGIRSGPRDEWDYIRAHDTLTTVDALGAALARVAGRPLYVTLDIDAFDPSLVPGTGTPEPGGLFWADFQRIIEILRPHGAQIVGLDVMELSPGLDPSGVSSVVAAKSVRQLLLVATDPRG